MEYLLKGFFHTMNYTENNRGQMSTFMAANVE